LLLQIDNKRSPNDDDDESLCEQLIWKREERRRDSKRKILASERKGKELTKPAKKRT
jgi:hypothetical protein